VTDTRQGVSELRSLLVEIYPPALEGAGLASALDDLAMLLRTRGVRTTVTVDSDLHLSAEQERTLYRIVQEAARNTARHAHATTADITVTRTPRGTRATVTDDGVGFDLGAPDAGRHEHFGLVMAAELAAESGGQLHVDSRPGGPTTVRLDLP
jgi:signal transduction histidine kinase